MDSLELALNIHPDKRGDLIRSLRRIDVLVAGGTLVTDDKLYAFFLGNAAYLIKVRHVMNHHRGVLPSMMRDSLNTITTVDSYTVQEQFIMSITTMTMSVELLVILGIWAESIKAMPCRNAAPMMTVNASVMDTVVTDMPYELMSVDEVMACF